MPVLGVHWDVGLSAVSMGAMSPFLLQLALLRQHTIATMMWYVDDDCVCPDTMRPFYCAA